MCLYWAAMRWTQFGLCLGSSMVLVSLSCLDTGLAAGFHLLYAQMWAIQVERLPHAAPKAQRKGPTVEASRGDPLNWSNGLNKRWDFCFSPLWKLRGRILLLVFGEVDRQRCASGMWVWWHWKFCDGFISWTHADVRECGWVKSLCLGWYPFCSISNTSML